MSSQNTKHTVAIFNHNFFAGVRRLTTLGLLALLITQMLSLPLLAQGRIPDRKAKDETVFVNPLDRNDPRAQLDPQLANAQPMPQGGEQQGFSTGAQEPTVVEYDMATGQETRTTGQISALQNEALDPVSGMPGVRRQTSDLEQSLEQSGQQTTNFLCVDDKQAKHYTWQYPWSTQVKLFITFPNGGTYVGSGTIIASKYVITHKNNLYYAAFGGWATRIEVVPGLDGYYKPFGSAYSYWLRYYDHGSSNIGLITLDRHIGFSTGTLGYGSSFAQYYGNIAGYPVSKDYGRVLYYDSGSAYDLSYDRAHVSVLFLSGEMGAGTYLINSAGHRYVWGVSANLYYCSTTVDRITSWIHGQFNYVISNGL